jgi:hypothetical protein
MKHILLYSIILLTGLGGFTAHAQVGINTIKPTAALDVNGNVRIRNLDPSMDNFLNNGGALFIMGVDKDGNIVPIEIGPNIKLQDNKLVVDLPADEPIELPDNQILSELYTSPSEPLINDMDLGIVILPGDPRGKRPVIRLSNGANQETVEITGFKSAADGAIAHLYPTSGDLKLKTNSSKSQPDNRIAAYGDIELRRFEMVQLMYDGQINRWVVMSSQDKPGDTNNGGNDDDDDD